MIGRQIIMISNVLDQLMYYHGSILAALFSKYCNISKNGRMIETLPVKSLRARKSSRVGNPFTFPSPFVVPTEQDRVRGLTSVTDNSWIKWM